MHDESHVQPPITRREFAVTTLAAGFALSTRPVAAETITTDTKGLTAGEVKVPVFKVVAKVPTPR